MADEPVVNIEKANMSKVNVHPSGPTEADEMAILTSLFFYSPDTGVFTEPRYGD